MQKAKASVMRLVRYLILGGVAVGLIIAIVVYALTRKPPPVKAKAIQARLELSAGNVELDSGKGYVLAVSGTPLLSGAKLKTSKGARALVRLPDGSRLFLRGGSELSLPAGRVELASGEYFLDAPPSDRKPLAHVLGQVKVTAEQAGASIRRQGDKVMVYVARGMATISAQGGRAEVKAGQEATTTQTGSPKVAALAFWDDWTGGMADFAAGKGIPGAGSGSIYGVDVGALAGSRARALVISKQSVKATIRDGISETRVDQTFFNPSERDVEGWYWFMLPKGASVTGFALETNGVLVEGEFNERKQAKARYTSAKASGHSPAILEWVDENTYRARIYPVLAGGTRRVVVRYLQLSSAVDNKLTYVYPMGQGSPVRIGEFSLAVDLGDAGKQLKLATLADARVEQGGRMVTMRRSGYTPRADFQLEATLPKGRPPLTLSRMAPGGESADYVMVRYTPDIEWKKLKQQRGEVVVVVDTSAAGDDSTRQLKTAAAESILRALSDEDRFSLVALDVRPTVLYPKKGLTKASDKEIEKALERLADHSTGGATDLAALFDVALKRLHGAEQPAIVYVGDGIPTSGEMSGEQLVDRLRRALGTSRARLFTVGVGNDAHHALLAGLARAGGGEHFIVREADESTANALQLASAVKLPTLTDLEIDLGAGLDEPFSSATGKVSRGSDVIVLARTHHDMPRKVAVRGRIAGEKFEKSYELKRVDSVLSSFVPRLWAAEYVRRLLGGSKEPEAERGRIAALGIEYGLMTPFTSIIALESEAAYSRMGIQRRRSPLRGVQLTSLDPQTERRLLGRLGAVPAVSLPGCSKRFAAMRDEGEESESPAVANKKKSAAGPPEGAYGLRGAAKPAPVTASPPPLAQDPAEETGKDTVVEQKSAELLKADDQPKGPQDLDENVADPAPTVAMPRPRKLPNKPKLAGPGRTWRASEPNGLGKRGGDISRLLSEKESQNDREKASSLKAPAAALKGGTKLEAGTKGLLRVVLRTCSDVARRPLAQRVLLWKKRLRAAVSARQLLSRYDAARQACELIDWRAERTFLQLMQRGIDSEGDTTAVLQHFASRPEVQKYLARLILRRTVDGRVVSAVERVLFGSAVSWNKVDLALSEIDDVDKRIALLRREMAKAPADPNGGIRMVKLLVEAKRPDEAVALGRRLRDQGFLTPAIARQLGDVLARAGHSQEAVRTYSEIVEFDRASIKSRRLLGDIYLGHGWYEPAYRQFRTITEQNKSDALGFLRLAAAAAGAGRVDEALRLERKVAAAEGRPGPDDPRRWARLFSAARLARLIESPPKGAQGKVKSIKRELKELGLFSGPGHLVVVTWEELSNDLLLTTQVAEEEVLLGQVTDAAKSGLSAVLLSKADGSRARFSARLRSTPVDHAFKLMRHDVIWNGQDFEVRVGQKSLAKGATGVAL